jgi:hypothetical protein
MRLRRQVAAFVRTSTGGVRLVVWTAWESRGRRRSEVMVFRIVRTLLPRDRIGHAVESSMSDVPEEDLETWLMSHGYEMIARLDSPALDEHVSRW